MPGISFVVTRGVSSPVNEEERFIATPSGGGHSDYLDLSINIPLRPDSPFVGDASGRGVDSKCFSLKTGEDYP